jgi:peptidyl-prolyl cis-trans isomerase B (cyclophilin B)
MAKRRKSAPQRSHVYQAGELRPGFSRRQSAQPVKSGPPRTWIGVGIVVIVAILAVLAYALGYLPGGPGASPSPSPRPTAVPRASFDVSPPSATPLASPFAAPAGDGTRATIETELGNIVLELYTESSPVAAENFINLAEAGFYHGVVFHRIVPGFVIQGGDPEGTGGGGPGYEIRDDPVVGEYTRGVVAMARPANQDGSMIPDSQGSQFFIVLDDSVKDDLSKSGGYSIFANVVEGMEVVDEIAAGAASGQTALDPVVMTRVTISRP